EAGRTWSLSPGHHRVSVLALHGRFLKITDNTAYCADDGRRADSRESNSWNVPQDSRTPNARNRRCVACWRSYRFASEQTYELNARWLPDYMPDGLGGQCPGAPIGEVSMLHSSNIDLTLRHAFFLPELARRHNASPYVDAQ